MRPVDPGTLTLDWALNEASEERFEQRIAKAPLKDLVQLQWEMIDRFRNFRGSHTIKRTAKANAVPTYPAEFYLLWYRTHTVQRQIVERRDSQEEAPIAPEVNREIERLTQKFSEDIVQA